MSKQLLIAQLDQAVTEILGNPDAMPSSVDASLVDLLQLAHDLRELPRPHFKARLRSELERKTSMSTKTVQFRQGFRTVTPYVVLPAAEAMVAFVKQAFGAEETLRHSSGPGFIHAEVRIGDSMIMIGGGPAYTGPARPSAIHIYVANSDEVYRRALAAGAVSTLEMTEDHGERFACIQDPFGNPWIIATHLGRHYIAEHHHTVTPFVYARGAAEFIDFMKQAFGAAELLRADLPDGTVKHAKVRIGDSVLATGEAGQLPALPTMLYLHVPDADAVYEQAIRAGAQSIHPPVDQPYGDRNGGVTDAWGNQWYIATPL